MSFKDVSYVKNKTHQLRVAKIQKSKEAQEKAAEKGLLELYVDLLDERFKICYLS